jgi:hypothetical protein
MLAGSQTWADSLEMQLGVQGVAAAGAGAAVADGSRPPLGSHQSKREEQGGFQRAAQARAARFVQVRAAAAAAPPARSPGGRP